MARLVGHNKHVESYNVAEAKMHLSEILERVSEGEEILLTRRGKPIARVIPVAPTAVSILGAGQHDPNLNPDILAGDDWWKPMADDEAKSWYE